MKTAKILIQPGLISTLLLMVLALWIQPILGQTQDNIQYPEETLQSFIEASMEIHQIQEAGEQKMLQALEKENLDVDTFNEIAEMMNGNETTSQDDISAAQILSFNNVIERFQAIQSEMRQEMENAITGKGMGIEEYQQIIEDYYQDPELQQKINEMIQQ